ncbi:MAG: hypothetical protein GTO45_38425 [Candidatus Aminicenantes bacterium]|nr:hypothetical protein [Candidatus Aminicenantes bacterium]NIM82042.1 hypothetical protein [Candidatus Aminicenantes bacterium]NIN24021.1 hypothetical protein [Candidatus Aminicenantes bacterium]NIN45253.1 hypothetical protein [Candidatus Aminicenantes bacterium]NIN90665.1 hypothetical protein [Candidatus Aminicenantes bacterium]
MNCLVIIPTTGDEYAVSAPLAWMFNKHLDNVKGIFGFQLTKELVMNHDLFIIELNWFFELAEFKLLVEYIKQNNRNANILFGGLYAALKYKEIFHLLDVDYFIQGDNEMPMQMLLDSVNPKEIPNLTGKDFENPVQYVFKEDDYYNLEFSLDWFPSYSRFIEADILYQLPMILTSKGGCATVHKGCDYCMGSKHQVLKKIYNRPPLVMSNDVLMHLLEKVEKKFKNASLILLSQYNYDFSTQSFDLDMTVEIDCKIPPEKIKDVLYGFKKCVLNIPTYAAEGLSRESIERNYKEIMQMEDEDHKVKFFGNVGEAATINISEAQKPGSNSESALPEWAHWDFYMDLEQAYIFSEVFYHKLDAGRKFTGG